MVARRQHYVWRHYLSKWKSDSGVVSCLRNGKIFQSNPKNLMVERDFYKLQQLDENDLVILRKMVIDKTRPPILRRMNADLIESFAIIAKINGWIQTHPQAAKEYRYFARNLVIETEENLHSLSESEFIPVFDRILLQTDSILDDDDDAFNLIYFLCMQYFRTKNMRDRAINAIDEGVLSGRARKLVPLLCHCIAVNVSHSLFLERNDLELVFVKSSANGEFITGDQPVVNMLAQDNDSPPEELVLYYPVCPILAVILAPKRLNFGDRFSICGLDTQQSLNDLIVVHSQDSIIASRQEALEMYRSRIVSNCISPFVYSSETESKV